MLRRTIYRGATYGSTPKDIQYSMQCRKTLLRGVENLVKAVGVTLGPKGRNVILEIPYQPPKITKDGVTVAKQIEFENNFENMGAQLVRQVAGLTNDTAGDGTTTATILSGAIFSEGFKSAATGTNPMDLKRGIDLACKEVLISLAEQARMVTAKSEIAQVARISANSDREIGSLIADAMQQVGKDGVITVQEGRTLHTELELVEGMSFEQGYLSPYFVTNTRMQKCELENALVYLANRKLTDVAHILPALNVALQRKRPLLIIADEIEGEALHTFLFNRMQNKLVGCAVKAPGFGDLRVNHLQDMAVFTGATMVSEDLGLSLQNSEFNEQYLGSCKKVTITKDETMMLEGGGSAIALEERIHMLKDMIAVEDHEFHREKLVQRLAKLSGGVAVIKVGGASEVEIAEKKDRIVDSLNATRAAVAEGILAGGGTALLMASNRLHKLSKDRTLIPDIRTGINIVKKAIRLPAKVIAQNAGVEGSVVVGKVMAKGDSSFGYDAQNAKYVDMFEAGIVDPMKVTKSSVVNACSVAGMMITTEASICEKFVETSDHVDNDGIANRSGASNPTVRQREDRQQAKQRAAGGYGGYTRFNDPNQGQTKEQQGSHPSDRILPLRPQDRNKPGIHLAHDGKGNPIKGSMDPFGKPEDPGTPGPTTGYYGQGGPKQAAQMEQMRSNGFGGGLGSEGGFPM